MVLRSGAPAAHGLGGVSLPARRSLRSGARMSGTVAVHAVMDSSAIEGVVQQLYTLADASMEVVPETSQNTGWLAPIVGVLETVLKVIDNGLEAANVPYSYGFAIILLTLGVKVLTYPLSKQQVESTLAMQSLQPAIKSLQKKYAYDKERLQMETAKLYQDAGVNPLAGCLPTLATLPVWIGLYRALTNVANDGLLTEGFFWIPSLAGPSSMADNESGGGMSWLLPLTDGAPPVGWHDAAAYLVMPVLLIVSQYISQAIISPTPKDADPATQQSTAILKFLPLMIGWFSLNVPSGLTLYWFTNNILTTAQQVYLRNATPKPATVYGTASMDQGPASSATIDAEVLDGSGSGGPSSTMSRRERREQERNESRGKRFRERKQAEKAGKAPAEAESENSDVSA